MKIFFVGAGPGDPELLTLKGKNIIETADVIIYAGSLVNPELLRFAKKEALIYDSAKMNLEEIFEVFKKFKGTDCTVARIHSGDPSLYSAIQEQMEWCDIEEAAYEIIPGVSSFCAACASLRQELTLPEITQSVIITRISGRTKVPQGEALEKLSRIKATLVIFLSVDRIEDVVSKLLHGYDPKTPAAVIYRASWRDEKIIRGTLKNIADKVRKGKVKKQALIIVGEVLGKKNFRKSRLYDKAFSHSHRK